MQIIDLFAGIGGFSLAGRWIGWRTIQFCENDNFCQKVLTKNFPGIPIHDNIETITKEHIINNVLYDKNETTIVTGGFPCQPFSHSGSRKGEEDVRYLWPEMYKSIRLFHPDWVVAENVYGIVNWNRGMVLEQVQTDLEKEGYDVVSCILPACASNAPHKRNRIWIIAYYDYNRQYKSRSSWGIAADPHNSRLEERWPKWFTSREFTQDCGLTIEPGVCRRTHGIPNRVDRLKTLGNAIVPQIAYEIYKTINTYINGELLHK